MTGVPSNLIPVRISRLPDAPVASEDAIMMIIYQGNNYKIRVGDLLSVAGVPTSRQVIAGTGLTGGGQLSSNVTLSIAPGGVGSTQLAASGVTPGTYGDSVNIPVFTVDSTGRVVSATTVAFSVSGYVPTSRQVIAGDGLSGGGALSSDVSLTVNLSNATPQFGYQSGEAGVSTEVARADHKHPAVDLSADDQVDNVLGLSNGGTARSLVADAGAIIWCGADGLYVGPVGAAGQVLVSGGTGGYTWGDAFVYSEEAANTVLAGPTSGAPATVTYRSLVNDDLPNSGVSANTYGSSTDIPVVTVNSKGVITGITTQPAAGATVLSVNGQTGTVVLVAADVGAQPADAQLTDIAGLTPADGAFIVGDGANFTTESGSTARNSLGAAASGANGDITSMTGLTGGVSSPDFVQFSGDAATLVAGKLWYDSATGSFNAGMGGGSITQQIGEELFVYGKASSAISDTPLQIVYQTGTVGASGVVTFAPTTSGITDGEKIIGIATENIALNGFGRVTSYGVVRGIDTTGAAYGETWADNDVIWYNPVTGNPTKTKPTAPNIKVQVGVIIHASSGGSGSIQVEIQHGSVLGGTDSNVQFGSLVNNDLIQYVSANGRWENVAATSITVGKATNIDGGAASQIPYQTGAGTTSFVANGTAGQVLVSAGAGAPSWKNPGGGTF